MQHIQIDSDLIYAGPCTLKLHLRAQTIQVSPLLGIFYRYKQALDH